MIASMGWVEDLGPTEVLIKLKAGRTFAFPKRPGLKWGTSVRVFWNEKTAKVGNVMTLDELNLLKDPREIPESEQLPPHDDDIQRIIDNL